MTTPIDTITQGTGDAYTVNIHDGKAKPMLTKQRRYTPEEWVRFAPLFSNWSVKMLEAARLILVEGDTAAEAGKAVGCTRQQAHLAGLKAHERLDKHGDGRLPLTVWVKRDEYEKTADMLRKKDCIIGGDDVVPEGGR